MACAAGLLGSMLVGVSPLLLAAKRPLSTMMNLPRATEPRKVEGGGGGWTVQPPLEDRCTVQRVDKNLRLVVRGWSTSKRCRTSGVVIIVGLATPILRWALSMNWQLRRCLPSPPADPPLNDSTSQKAFSSSFRRL